MVLLVFILLVFLGLGYPKSRGVTQLNALLMFLTLAPATTASDMEQFKHVYDNLYTYGLQFHYEPGYSILMIICKELGMDFFEFRIIWALLIVIIINAAVKRFTENTAMASALFILYNLFPMAS